MAEETPRTYSGPVAIIGCGQFGGGLAKRLAAAGTEVLLVGASPVESAAAAIEVASAIAPYNGAPVTGTTALDAATRAATLIVALPQGAVDWVFADADVRTALEGKPVISCVVPMAWHEGDAPEYVAPPEGSAAEHIAALLPKSHVASALHDVSAWSLHRLEEPIPSDVFIAAADDIAAAAAAAVVAKLPVHRVQPVGPLAMSRETEHLTVLICQINRMTHQHTSVELSGVTSGAPQRELG